MIDDVTSINNSTESIDPRKSEKIVQQKSSKQSAGKSKSVGAQGDSVAISTSAKSALEKTRLINMVKNLPEIREEKVEQAKAKMESGELFSSESTEGLAKILDESL